MQIIHAFFFIVILKIIGSGMGLYKDIVIAERLGAGVLSDVYYMAISVPVLVYSVLNTTLNSVLLPIISKEYEKQGKEGAFKAANELLTVIIVLSCVLCIIGIVTTPILLKALAFGFKGEQFDMTVYAVRLLFPIIIFIGIATLLSTLCQVFNKLVAPEWMGIAVNVIIIAVVFFLKGNINMNYMVIATVLGYALQIVAVLPVLRKIGYRFEFKLKIDKNLFKVVTNLSWPVFIGTLALQMYLSVDKAFASMLPAGSVTYLSYATKIRNVPITVLVLALAKVMFPTLARLAVKDQDKQFRVAVVRVIDITILFGAVLTILFSAFSEPIVRILFGRGNFSNESVLYTSQVLMFFSIGFMPIIGKSTLSRVFYSMHDTKVPTYFNISALVLNVVLDAIFVQKFGLGGIALATTVASFINFIGLIIILERRLKLKDYGLKYMQYCTLLVISIVSGVVGTYLAKWIVVADSFIGMLLQITFAMALTLACFVGVGVLTKNSVIGGMTKEVVKFVKPKSKISAKVG